MAEHPPTSIEIDPERKYYQSTLEISITEPIKISVVTT